MILPISTLYDVFTHFGGFFSISMGQLALKFHWDKMCFFWLVSTVSTYKLHWNYFISLLMTVQEAHKEYNSLTDQKWAKYEQLVWVSWHPSIQSWSLWIGKSTCSCEPTLPETEPDDSKGIIQAHVLQALKMLLVLNYRQAVWLGYGGCSFVPIDI